jgi:EAL domain-containing protein (putative c-di-GMP-specific phosphodiesterase class I)
MRLVAEGIETVEELAFIRALEFDIGQGYLFSHALPARQVVPWMQGFVPHDASPVPAASSISRSLK